MEEDRSDDLLVGTSGYDKFQKWAAKNTKEPTTNLKGKEFLDTTQKVLGDAWQGARTVQNWKDPGDVIAAGTARTVEGGLKAIGAVSQLPVAKQILDLTDKPVQWVGDKGGEYLESKGIDPRFAHIAARGADLAIGGGLVKGGAKLTKFVGRQALARAGDYLHPLAAGMGGTGQAWATAGKITDRADLDAFRKSTTGKNILEKAYDHLEKFGDFTNFKEGAAWGIVVRNKRGKGKVDFKNKQGLSLDSIAARRKDGLKRLEPMKEDIPSIQRVFDAIADKNPKYNKATAKSYIETNRTVVRKVTEAITDFNNNVKATTKGWTNDDLLSLEHIFDVDFHNRLKAELPSFPGRGANELTNLKAISYALNSRTGAMNKKIKVHDALIDTVKKGQGLPNYEKSIAQFIYEDIGSEVKKFTKDDWKKFTGEVLSRPDSTIQDVLVDMIRNKPKKRLLVKKTKPTQWSEKRASNIKRDLELGINAPRKGELGAPSWKVGDALVTWYPESMQNPLKGYGQIDILEQTGNKVQKGFKALNKDFENAIKEFPSGTKVILNMVKGDKKREAIYTRLFNQPKWKGLVKRNPDPNLGWIYTAP